MKMSVRMKTKPTTSYLALEMLVKKKNVSQHEILCLEVNLLKVHLTWANRVHKQICDRIFNLLKVQNKLEQLI